MPIKRTKKTVAPPHDHIIVGFSFPNAKRPEEHITASTRYGIWLSLSSQIYFDLLKKIDKPETNGVSRAEVLAPLAFQFANIYLQELDAQIASEIAKNPPPISNNGN